MAKYILKESELVGIIHKIISEEITRLDEGLGKTLLNTAKFAGRAAVSPFSAANQGISKYFDLISGNVGFGRRGKASSSGKSGNGKAGKVAAAAGAGAAAAGAAAIAASKNKIDPKAIIKEYGEPETVAMLGTRLTDKKPITVTNFLGSSEDVDFGKHYYEVNQDSADSIWSKTITKAAMSIGSAKTENELQRCLEQCYDFLQKWLNKRDKMYVKYVNAIQKKGRK